MTEYKTFSASGTSGESEQKHSNEEQEEEGDEKKRKRGFSWSCSTRVGRGWEVN